MAGVLWLVPLLLLPAYARLLAAVIGTVPWLSSLADSG